MISGTIEGVGSIVAGIFQFFVPILGKNLFWAFMILSIIAGLLILPLALRDLKSNKDEAAAKKKPIVKKQIK
jgi:hypothetical protein